MHDPPIAVLGNASILLIGLLKVNRVLLLVFAPLEDIRFLWMIGV